MTGPQSPVDGDSWETAGWFAALSILCLGIFVWRGWSELLWMSVVLIVLAGGAAACASLDRR